MSQKSMNDELGNATSTELVTMSPKKLKPCTSWANAGERPESFRTEKIVENGRSGEHKVWRPASYTCSLALGLSTKCLQDR